MRGFPGTGAIGPLQMNIIKTVIFYLQNPEYSYKFIEILRYCIVKT